MIGMGKHVHRLDLLKPIPSLHHLSIPGHGGRIARNIDNPVGAQLKHLIDNILVGPEGPWDDNL